MLKLEPIMKQFMYNVHNINFDIMEDRLIKFFRRLFSVGLNIFFATLCIFYLVTDTKNTAFGLVVASVFAIVSTAIQSKK